MQNTHNLDILQNAQAICRLPITQIFTQTTHFLHELLSGLSCFAWLYLILSGFSGLSGLSGLSGYACVCTRLPAHRPDALLIVVCIRIYPPELLVLTAENKMLTNVCTWVGGQKSFVKNQTSVHIFFINPISRAPLSQMAKNSF